MSARLETLKSYLKEDPKDTFIIFAIAKEYEKSDQLKYALEYYLQLKNIDSNYIGLYYHLGKLYERLSNIDTAKSTYIIGIELAKESKDFHAASELNGALEMIS